MRKCCAAASCRGPRGKNRHRGRSKPPGIASHDEIAPRSQSRGRGHGIFKIGGKSIERTLDDGVIDAGHRENT